MTTGRFVDSHTGGEPTRVLLDPPPALLARPSEEHHAALAGELFPLARALVGEPRTSSAAVGAFLLPPEDPANAGGVVFVNDVGPLWMCVHGMIGLAATLRHLGRLDGGPHRFETPAGIVAVTAHPDRSISVENVPARVLADGVPVVTSGGPLRGTLAWGGNGFLILEPSPLPITPDRLPALLDLTREVRLAIDEAGIRGPEGETIDHVALFGRPEDGTVRNFVLCPGGAWDRSPCGTGTSAWLAHRAAIGHLREGEERTVESIIGSRFRGAVRAGEEGAWIPTIRGSASIVAEGILHEDHGDPYPEGIPRLD